LLLRERHRAAAGVLGVALPATWSGTGHAHAEGGVLAPAIDTLHLIAMSAWLGGLVFLAVTVLRRPAPEKAVDRFSRVAMVSVGVLVATGTYQAWRGLGSLAALPGSAYGKVLVFKLSAVVLLVWLGAMSRAMVRRRYLVSPKPRVAAQATADLRRSVRMEVAVASVVLGLTSVLVATPPAARPDTPPAPPAPSDVEQTVLPGGAGVKVRVDPCEIGANTLSVAVGRDVPEVTAEVRLPDRALGPFPVTLRRTGPARTSRPASPCRWQAPGGWT